MLSRERIRARERRRTTTRPCAVCGSSLRRRPSRFRGVLEPVCGPPMPCRAILLSRRATGRYVSHDGYVMIRVGPDHPLAEASGYAREHRVVLSQKLGRWMAPDETVVWLDGNRQNNAPENLVLRVPRQRAS